MALQRPRTLLTLAAVLLAACGAPAAAPAPAATTAAALAPSRAPPARAPSAAPAPPSPAVAPVGLRDCPLLDPPGRCAFIDVGGYDLWLVCRGTGSPTIVLEAGFGGDSRSWDSIVPATTALAQTCVYDRAGLGSSDVPPQAVRTSQHVVTDLQTLLTQAAIPPPYVLVGHSFGGIHVRLFAAQYPDAVRGLVLVDASSPGQAQRMATLQTLLPPPTPRECPPLTDLRTGASGKPDGNPEHLDVQASLALVDATQDLDALPLAVLTAGRPNDWPACVPQAYGEQHYTIWLELQAQLPTLSTNSVHIMATESGHDIQFDEPDLVSDAIGKVVAAARSGGPVAGNP